MVRGSRQLGVRWLAMVAALCCLGGQFAAVAHFAVVRHGICATHGEAIHVDAAAHGAASSAKTAALAADAPCQAGEGEPDHEHDHCLVAARLREAVAAPAAHAEPRAPSAEPSADPARTCERAAQGGVAALRLAPKNSPPA